MLSFSQYEFILKDICIERATIAVSTPISLSVRNADYVTITGPNGCGKTSLLKIICGLSLDFNGKITAISANHDAQNRPAINPPELCHYVGHENGLNDSLTVKDQLKYYAMALATSSYSDMITEATKVAPKLDLTDLLDRHIKDLSAGQKRRLALARLALSSRMIWCLDEPTAALDIIGQITLSNLIEQHLKRGGIIFCTSHDDVPSSSTHLVEFTQ